MKDKCYECMKQDNSNNISNISMLIDKGIIKVQDLSEVQKDELVKFYTHRINTNKYKLYNIKNEIGRKM